MKWNSLKALAASTVLMSGMAFAGPDLGAAEQQPTNWPAIIMFLIFVGATLFILNGQRSKPRALRTSIPQAVVFLVSKMV